MLLNTLIAGVNDESVQRKLISKAKELTVDKALDIIRAYESTKSQMKDIMDSTEVACWVRKSHSRGMKQRHWWSGQGAGQQYKSQINFNTLRKLLCLNPVFIGVVSNHTHVMANVEPLRQCVIFVIKCLLVKKYRVRHLNVGKQLGVGWASPKMIK